MSIIDVYASDKSYLLPLASEVRAAELAYCQQQGIESYELMQSAGNSLWEFIQQFYPQASNFLVITGPGNNAGDGFEIARLLKLAGHQVRLRFVSKSQNSDDYVNAIAGDAKIALTKLQQAKISIEAFQAEHGISCDLVIDGILGSGIKPPARAEFVAAIAAINAANQAVLSIDIPSGLDADCGSEVGVAIRAQATLSFVGLKPGLVTAEGKQCCGKLYLDELAVEIDSSNLKQQRQLVSLKSEIAKCDQAVLTRKVNSHKGSHGRTLVIGGNHGMGGAALLAATSAYRCGSGAVMMITRSENIPASLEQHPEIMAIGSDDIADIESIEIALKSFESASSIVIGPGLGNDQWAKFWLQEALSRDLPTVVDADGLRLAKQLGFSLSGSIITPHPGEAKALLDDDSEDLQRDRYDTAIKLQGVTDAYVVLKGAGTLIIDPELNIKVCRYGNAGMATAGMGDVLAGIIGSLLSQGFSKQQAAIIGTLMHSLSGDRAADQTPIGLMASDLFGYIRTIRNELSNL
jgi:NAD(P)H-hydrate epimerase